MLALALRLFRLGHQSLWIDETFSLLASGIGRPFGIADLLENVHGPLYALLLHVWGSVAGDSEWALRLPSALFGAATVPAIAWLGAQWLGRETAAPAAWLAAFSPFLVWYSQETRSYALLLFAVTLSSALLLTARRSGRVRDAVGAIAMTVAGVLSSFSFAFVLPVHARWWVDRGSGDEPEPGVIRDAKPGAGMGRPGSPRVRVRPRFPLGAAITALALVIVVLPWMSSIARTWDWSRLARFGAAAGETPLRGQTTFHPAAVPFALYTFAAGPTLAPALRELRRDPAGAVRRSAPWVAATALVFGGLGVLGLVAIARRGRLLDALLWILPALLVVSWFALRNFKVFNPRYLMPVFPVFLLAIAAAFADLRPRGRLAFGLAVTALWSVSLHHHYFDPRFGREDYRGAFQRIRAEAAPDERVVAVGADHPVVYYNRGLHPVTTVWLGFAEKPDRLDREVDRARSGAPAAWFVVSRSEDLDPAGRFGRRMNERFPAAERFAVEGVEVWRVPADAGAR